MTNPHVYCTACGCTHAVCPYAGLLKRRAAAQKRAAAPAAEPRADVHYAYAPDGTRRQVTIPSR